MRRAQSLTTGQDEHEINLTPMLDVVFIMLIFFIVTASFMKEAGFDLNRNDAVSEHEVVNDTILIQISADNDVLLADRTIDPRALRANLSRLSAENPDAVFVVQAHNRSKNQLLIRVLDQARLAGIYDIALAK